MQTVLRIATWNVNSINVRLENVLTWMKRESVDVLLLQEVKCETAAFPQAAFAEIGYQSLVVGQKGYNGVAILSRRPMSAVALALDGDAADEQARFVAADIDGLTVASLYLPNGNPTEDGVGPKFLYKLAWMKRLEAWVERQLAAGRPFVLGGDFNVIPHDNDCYDPAAWRDDALFRPETRACFRRILNLGVVDAFRALHARSGAYTFWDYQGGGWDLDKGIRIDHFLLSPQATDLLEDCMIDRAPRAEKKASDHTPVILTLREAPQKEKAAA